jgi:hypothetical protein
MKSMLRRALEVSVLSAGFAVVAAAPALAQGRSRDVPPGIAKNGKCPPGLEKQGRCSNARYDDRYDRRRDDRYDDRTDRRRNDSYDDRIRTRPDADRCWDRNRDGRCDYVTAARREADWCWDRNRDGRCDNTSAGRVTDRVDPRYDPRTGERDRGTYVDRTLGDLIDRARRTAGNR